LISPRRAMHSLLSLIKRYSITIIHLSNDKHRVAEREKPVTHLDRVAISREDFFPVVKGAYHHQQGRARQMKIGDKRVDGFKTITGIDKDIGFRAFGAEKTVPGIDRLQGPGRCRS